MSILIKHGRVINPTAGIDGIYDLYIEGDRVAAMERELNPEADIIINARGQCVVPGFIDLHVHLREPGFEYKENIETGTKAAAKGGFTTIVAMPNTNPVVDSVEVWEDVNRRVAESSQINVIQSAALTLKERGLELSDIAALAKAGCKVFSEDGRSVMDSKLCKEAMKLITKHGGVFFDHCEDLGLVDEGVINEGIKSKEYQLKGISNSVEDVITARDILLAGETNCPLHLCHMSTRGSVRLLSMAREDGLQVTGEVCPHHFILADTDIKENHGNFKMNPPLRSPQDREAMLWGISSKVISAISTDHAPHGYEENNQSFDKAPNGIIGLETAYPLAQTYLVDKGLISMIDLVNMMSVQPAQILGIDKGDISVGKIADITIIKTNENYTIDSSTFVSKGRNMPFEGWDVNGKVMTTICQGEVVFQELI